MGLRIKVAGNSFIVSRNTKAAADRMPGLTKGSVIDVKTRKGVPAQTTRRVFQIGAYLQQGCPDGTHRRRDKQHHIPQDQKPGSLVQQ